MKFFFAVREDERSDMWKVKKMERVARLELVTPTLARLCSTN